MYSEGLAVPQDLAEAIRLYQSVAQQEPRAQLELARIYSLESGNQAARRHALRWYSAILDRAVDQCVDDPITAAFVGSVTLEELEEANAYVARAIGS
jgi:TPR repeat protein